MGAICTTSNRQKGILGKKYRDANRSCLAILFDSIAVRGRRDSRAFSFSRSVPPSRRWLKTSTTLAHPPSHDICGDGGQGRAQNGLVRRAKPERGGGPLVDPQEEQEVAGWIVVFAGFLPLPSPNLPIQSPDHSSRFSRDSEPILAEPMLADVPQFWTNSGQCTTSRRTRRNTYFFASHVFVSTHHNSPQVHHLGVRLVIS